MAGVMNCSSCGAGSNVGLGNYKFGCVFAFSQWVSSLRGINGYH